jgi:hypothetical protein
MSEEPFDRTREFPHDPTFVCEFDDGRLIRMSCFCRDGKPGLDAQGALPSPALRGGSSIHPIHRRKLSMSDEKSMTIAVINAKIRATNTVIEHAQAALAMANTAIGEINRLILEWNKRHPGDKLRGATDHEGFYEVGIDGIGGPYGGYRTGAFLVEFNAAGVSEPEIHDAIEEEVSP